MIIVGLQLLLFSSLSQFSLVVNLLYVTKNIFIKLRKFYIEKPRTQNCDVYTAAGCIHPTVLQFLFFLVIYLLIGKLTL